MVRRNFTTGTLFIIVKFTLLYLLHHACIQQADGEYRAVEALRSETFRGDVQKLQKSVLGSVACSDYLHWGRPKDRRFIIWNHIIISSFTRGLITCKDTHKKDPRFIRETSSWLLFEMFVAFSCLRVPSCFCILMRIL